MGASKKFQHPVPEKKETEEYRRRDVPADSLAKDPIIDAVYNYRIAPFAGTRAASRARALSRIASTDHQSRCCLPRETFSQPPFSYRRRRRLSTLRFPLRRIVSSLASGGGGEDGKI